MKRKFNKWLSGEIELLKNIDYVQERSDASHAEVKKEKKIINKIFETKTRTMLTSTGMKSFYTAYTIFAILCCLTLIGVLIIAVSGLPRFGEEHSYMNEVISRYVSKGVEETGAINTVAGMILDYRAFDTLGESFVLFTALNCVLILLRNDEENSFNNISYFSISNDNILRRIVSIVFPVVLISGIYIVLNGHLSPGGGFSGGAVMGAGIILYSMAFGSNAGLKLISPKRFTIASACALGFYCIAKCYSFFTGANGLESGIPLGVPGTILSSGLILPLNIAVGLVVTCTMYGIYSMFKRGAF